MGPRQALFQCTDAGESHRPTAQGVAAAPVKDQLSYLNAACCLGLRGALGIATSVRFGNVVRCKLCVIKIRAYIIEIFFYLIYYCFGIRQDKVMSDILVTKT